MPIDPPSCADILITCPGALLGRYTHSVLPSETTRSPFGSLKLMDRRFGSFLRSTPRDTPVVPVRGFVIVCRKSADMLLMSVYLFTARSITAAGAWACAEVAAAPINTAARNFFIYLLTLSTEGRSGKDDGASGSIGNASPNRDGDCTQFLHE